MVGRSRQDASMMQRGKPSSFEGRIERERRPQQGADVVAEPEEAHLFADAEALDLLARGVHRRAVAGAGQHHALVAGARQRRHRVAVALARQELRHHQQQLLVVGQPQLAPHRRHVGGRHPPGVVARHVDADAGHVGDPVRWPSGSGGRPRRSSRFMTTRQSVQRLASASSVPQQEVVAQRGAPVEVEAVRSVDHLHPEAPAASHAARSASRTPPRGRGCGRCRSRSRRHQPPQHARAPSSG